MKRAITFLMIFCILWSVCGCKNLEITLEPVDEGYPEEPLPTVTVTIEGKQPDCIGGSSWTWYKRGDGTATHIFSCGGHPLDMEYRPFETSVARAEIHFSEPPTSFGVNAWLHDPAREGSGGVETLTLPVEDHTFALLEGDYVYEIHATWEYEDRSASGQSGFNAKFTPENLKNAV